MNSPTTRLVTIAVLTYKRPADLLAALPQLLEQLGSIDCAGEVLVIDNDPAASARAAVEGLHESNLRYAHEATPGIAAARNRALDECPHSDVLVFIDDDERPVAGWLCSLLAVFERSHPIAVVGPVRSEFSIEPDPWIVAGRFFERRRPATGTVVDVAATNNILLDLRQIRERGVRFDEKFGLSGGSDTLFSRELSRGGARMEWCAEALVVDVVPPERLTRRWVLRRSFRSGNSWSRTTTALAHGPVERLRRRARLLLDGSVRVGYGASRFLVGLLTRSLQHRARGLRTAARGAGMVTGAVGYVFVEYRRRQG